MSEALSRIMSHLTIIKAWSWNTLRCYLFESRMATIAYSPIPNTLQSLKRTLHSMITKTNLRATHILRLYLYIIDSCKCSWPLSIRFLLLDEIPITLYWWPDLLLLTLQVSIHGLFMDIAWLTTWKNKVLLAIKCSDAK